MTTPNLNAEGEVTMTDEEIAFARGDAERDMPGGMADHVLRLCDAITEARRERDEAARRLDSHRDWYQQRFNRLRQWINEEVRPLSAEVATRYFAIVANGSASPHESADWRDTMHGLTLRAERAERERDEARRQVTTAREAERRDVVAYLQSGAVSLAALGREGDSTLCDEMAEQIEAGRHVGAGGEEG